MDTSDSHSGAVERFEAAREERDRRAGRHNAASGSPEELPAFTELQAAEEQPRGKRRSSRSSGTTRPLLERYPQ